MTAAIIFVNLDTSDSVKSTLSIQLNASESMSGAEFDARFAADPNYPTIVHNNDLRILVFRSFSDLTNRSVADVAIFIKAGLASVEANKFGPPGLTLPVARLTLHELLKGTVPIATFIPNPNVQNNILYPFVEQEFILAPFGTRSTENELIESGQVLRLDYFSNPLSDFHNNEQNERNNEPDNDD